MLNFLKRSAFINEKDLKMFEVKKILGCLLLNIAFIVLLFLVTFICSLKVGAEELETVLVVSDYDGEELTIETKEEIRSILNDVYSTLLLTYDRTGTLSANSISSNAYLKSIDYTSISISSNVVEINENLKMILATLSENKISQNSISVNTISYNGISENKIDLLYENYNKNHQLTNALLVLILFALALLCGFYIEQAVFKRLRS